VGEISDVNCLQQVNNSIRPVVSGVLEMDVEIPFDKGSAVCGARLPYHLEIIHPCCTVVWDIDPHDVESFIACDKLLNIHCVALAPFVVWQTPKFASTLYVDAAFFVVNYDVVMA
jgi:hypothetical protein